MFKRLGIGIACLALAYSGYCGSGFCRAATIDTCDNGKSDKHDVCKDDGKIDFTLDDKDSNDICKDLKGCKELKDLKGDKHDKDGKDLVCLIDWIKDHNKGSCGQDNYNPDPCPVDDGGCHSVTPPPCGGQGGDPGGCDSVPAPAASEMSAVGVALVAVAGWLRSRRSYS